MIDFNQKIKIFSQSWGVPEEIGKFNAGDNAIANIGSQIFF